MCYYVYMATSKNHPIIEWDKNNPNFFVEELLIDDDIRKIFENRNVYYLGSDAGCGCGFMPGTKTLSDLREYLYNVSLTEEMIELLICELPYGVNQKVDKKIIEDLQKKKSELQLSILDDKSDSWWHKLKEYNRFT